MQEKKVSVGSKMNKYIIVYHSPIEYKGTYIVSAENGIEAGNKVSNYLGKKYGKISNSSSVVVDVYNNELIKID